MTSKLQANEPPSDSPVSRRSRGAFGSIKAIGWAFLGLRTGHEQQQDVARIPPLLWIATGLIAVFVLVLALIALVRWLVPMVGQGASW